MGCRRADPRGGGGLQAGAALSEPATLPGGTLTFVFTDIEGSTRLLGTLGRERYAELVVELAGLLRELFENGGGRQIDSQGDSAFFVFRSALDALLAAAAGQRAVAAGTWPAGVSVGVRIGIHTGEATLAGERYFGLAVHRAARIGAAAHGGQTVVSATTRDVAEDALPDGLSLEHLGEHRLKDIARPERLFQLVVQGLPNTFAPLRAVEGQAPGAFAGRFEELAATVEAAVALGDSLRVADADRDRVASQLREHTAAGRLSLEEFSERVGEALTARVQGELDRVTRELPAPVAPGPRRALRLALAVFGHTVRRGLLRLKRRAVAVSIFGDLDLDLRGAILERGKATVVVFALLGNADIYVPEGIDVDAGGMALGGHCRDWGRDAPLEGSPQLRVRVLTLLGTADVWRVPPGAQGGYGELIKGLRDERPMLPPG